MYAEGDESWLRGRDPTGEAPSSGRRGRGVGLEDPDGGGLCGTCPKDPTSRPSRRDSRRNSTPSGTGLVGGLG